MKTNHPWLKQITRLGLTMMMGMSMSACASTSWKEEVMLHDGQKIIVERSQSYGGRHEIGQPSPIKEQSITFTMPNSNNSITWKDEFSENIGHANFSLLALHILNGAPYIVVSPNGYISYSKWGSPNPPYVFFKYDGKVWQRISLEDFPTEFKNINLVISTLTYRKELTSQSFVNVEMVNRLNGSSGPKEYNSILRIPIDYGPPRPVYSGPKAPHPITPPTTTGGNK